MTDVKVTYRYIFSIAAALMVTWIIHEFAHWLTGRILGYESVMRLNGTFYKEGENPSDIERTIVSAAGPIITIIQGYACFHLLKANEWKKHLYPFLFIPFFMRTVAGMMNAVNLNDEGRISNFLNLGTYTLSIIVCCFLFYLVFVVSKKHKLPWKFQAVTTLLVTLGTTAIIMVDNYFKFHIIG